MALPATAVSWRNVKWAIRAAAEALPAAGAYLESLNDQEEHVDDLAWVRAVVRYQRATPAGTSEDYAQYKLDLLNITGGAVDTSWVASDFAACTTAISAFVTSVAAIMSPSHTAKEIRYYKMRFNDSDPGPSAANPKQQRPFAESGPPIALATLNQAGTMSGIYGAYQVAMTVTFKTAWPKHWGRIYLPGITSTMTSSGRWGGITQTIANNAFDLQDDLAAAGFLLQVPIAQVAKVRHHRLQAVTQIQVDDIPDVIRRRRPKQASVRSIGVE